MWVMIFKLIRNKIGHKLMQPLATNWRSDNACKKNLYLIMKGFKEAHKSIFRY